MMISLFVLGLAAAQAGPSHTTVDAAQARATGFAQAQQALSGTPAAAAPQVVPGPARTDEVLTDQTIISLVKAGLGPDTIVAKINASRGSYDTSTNALIELKQANVPDPVIAAMVNRSKSPVMANAAVDNANPDPLAPHSPGIYMLDDRGAGQMLRIDATVSNQTKTSNILGYAFTYGLSSAKLKTVIPNATARLQTNSRHPVFYFYLNQSNPLASLTDFSTGFTASASSPNEFSLVRLQKKGDHREAVIGSLGFASAKSGISDKARVAFTYNDIAPGVFKVASSTDLEPGEYGFVYSVSTGAGSASVARIFDFSVQ
jgi:hypothetical protein